MTNLSEWKPYNVVHPLQNKDCTLDYLFTNTENHLQDLMVLQTIAKEGEEQHLCQHVQNREHTMYTREKALCQT